MEFVFGELLYRPIYNLLIGVYNFLPYHDFGLAIIIVTAIIRVVLIPLSKKQIESQKKLQELQPKIKEIQEKHKNNKEKQTREMMEFYRKNKTNPLSGCLPTIFQLIFLIAIYRVLFNISQAGLKVDGVSLYSFIENPGQINQFFLGLVDLSRGLSLNTLKFSDVPHIILVALAALSQYFQTKMLMPKIKNAAKKDSNQDISQIMTQQMLYLGPILTLFIGFRFPAGLALYWLFSTVFSLIQQHYILKGDQKKDNQLILIKK